MLTRVDSQITGILYEIFLYSVSLVMLKVLTFQALPLDHGWAIIFSRGPDATLRLLSNFFLTLRGLSTSAKGRMWPASCAMPRSALDARRSY